MQKTQDLPSCISAFIEAITNLSSTSLAAAFTENATLMDESKPYPGRPAIQAWAQKLIVEYNAKIKVQQTWGSVGEGCLDVMMDGDYEKDFGITEPFPLYLHYKAEGDLISFMRINEIAPGVPTMKAVWAAKGNLENPLSVLRNDIFRQPEVPEGWVRVKVAAVGLNYHDIFTLRGQGMHPIKFPLILGSEGAGTLDDGSEVLIYPVMGSPDFKGDETLDPDRHVLGELTQGSLAEYVVVPRKNAIPKPPELSMIHASVLGIAWLTAYRMLFKLSGLKRGQTMLVQGSSGGVATALIQLGRAAGMTVWSTGRTEEKRAIATSLGAHQTFTPGEILPKLVDAVFDPSGIATWNHSLGSVVLGGTIVTCGGHSGMQVELDLKKVFVEQIKITGCYVGSFEDFQVLIKFIVEHKIEPKISKVLPVDRAEEGLRDLIEGSVQGKIVIKL